MMLIILQIAKAVKKKTLTTIELYENLNIHCWVYILHAYELYSANIMLCIRLRLMNLDLTIQLAASFCFLLYSVQ